MGYRKGNQLTGPSQRRVSSTTSDQVALASWTRASWSRCVHRARTALLIRLRVVSWPATSIRRMVPMSSASLSRSPSPSRAAISALVRSSPGFSRRAAAMVPISSTSSRTAAIASAGVVSVAMMTVLDRWCSRPRCSGSTPSSSQMTLIGSGSAKWVRRSATASGASAAARPRSSSRRAVSSSMRGRSRSTWRAVKALPTRERNRRWSAPSAVCMPWALANTRSGQSGAMVPSCRAGKCRASLAASGWARNSLSASCPRTTAPGTPPGRTTSATAPRARSRALRACGQPPAGSMTWAGVCASSGDKPALLTVRMNLGQQCGLESGLDKGVRRLGPARPCGCPAAGAA